MSKVYVTSDLHLSHKKVSELRGFKTIEEHDEAIEQNILDTVKKGDTLWILGDLLFNRGTRQHVLNTLCYTLEGFGVNLRLVLGNHDMYTTAQLGDMLNGKVFGAAYGKHGILFTHIPVHPGQKERFTMNVHGHLHGSVLPDPWYFNACLEQNNLRPFDMEEVYASIPLPKEEVEDEKLDSKYPFTKYGFVLGTGPGVGFTGTPTGGSEAGEIIPATHGPTERDL